MIKFFRNIRQKLISEGKITNYLKYAIGEIVLVMIGILLALQVSEWNTNRKQQQKEVQILHDIHKEFLENKEQLILVKSNHIRSYNSTKKLLNLLPFDVIKIEIDSVVTLLDGTYTNWTFNPNLSTINTLINTSSFDLISNPELRKLLQNWTDLFLDYSEEEIVARNHIRNFYIPYMSKYYEIKYVKNKRPFKDLNWDFLQSIEFHNTIGMRHTNLKDVLENQPNELEILSETIDKIIELTK
ncbi:MAG: hypothetical protein IPO92_22460 [Saprospiraceae bacterium]|nr:hypothetical protein [Saprospiraceae bacterium]